MGRAARSEVKRESEVVSEADPQPWVLAQTQLGGSRVGCNAVVL